MSKSDYTVECWDQFLEIANELDAKKGWVFRGQQRDNDEWILKTRIEQIASRYDIGWSELPKIEQGLIREFKRHYHHYPGHSPDDDDWMEWLAIMQHYGAPTRLLDASYSIFIGLFFAIARASIGDNKYLEIWAFNASSMADIYDKIIQDSPKPKDINDHDRAGYKALGTTILRGKVSFVRGINSFMQNERQRIQQGLFLVPINLQQSFMENLGAMESRSGSGVVKRIEIVCKKDFFFKAIPALRRMNVTSATLFPDIVGFAESLQMRMLMPESIVSKRDEFPKPLIPCKD